MINFRYHIVSLTAVFLALLIGILMGTTVVSKATVDGLKANVRRAEARSAAVHRTNDELTDELSTRTEVARDTDDALAEHALAHTVDGQLDAVTILVVATEDVDKNLMDQTLGALDAAGAVVLGTLVLTNRLGSEGQDADRLAELLELTPGTDPGPVAARRVAEELTTVTAETPERPGETIPDTTTADATTTTTVVSEEPVTPGVLDLLEENGYVKFRPGEQPRMPDSLDDALVAADRHYVVLTDPEPEPVDSAFVLPLVAEMARLGPVAQVFATGPADPADPDRTAVLVEDLLDRDGVEGHLSTVDDLGSYAGDVALVYALGDALEGHFGNYGLGGRADAVLPDIAPPEKTRSGPDR